MGLLSVLSILLTKMCLIVQMKLTVPRHNIPHSIFVSTVSLAI